ncbi:MAG: methionyl-tRNA formyltransferase [Candidatus Daviesbacteria bacterium]|nr:methionyl-tRNA formyltransferase [Candidatus Daviesbacteria bacterium]
MKKLKVAFLGTPLFVQPIKKELAKYFTSAESLNEADLAVVAAYGKILTKDELETPKFGCINVHPSLLPKYRGPSPIQQTILNGDKVTGITIIKMDDRVDHGPIIYQEQLELADIDNFATLSKKVFQRSAEILPKIIEDFSTGRIKTIPQNHNQATYCDKLTRESGYFAIDHPPSTDKLEKMIRAYYPWPGVWTKWNGKIVKFLPEDRIQMEGKRPISKKDFLNGYPNFPMNNTHN